MSLAWDAVLLTIITTSTYNKCHVLRFTKTMASPQQSGYQCQFVNSVRDYECPVCLHVTREPFLTSCCGQHFCQVCISRILTDNKPCPCCKENSFTTLLDKKQKRKVLSLTVYCKQKNKGCQWVGGLRELENHLCENCQFVEVNCPHNCGLAIQRQLLAKHQTNDCPERLCSCQYCHLEGTYKEIQDNHLPVCPKHPVSCPNQCRVSPLGIYKRTTSESVLCSWWSVSSGRWGVRRWSNERTWLDTWRRKHRNT